MVKQYRLGNFLRGGFQGEFDSLDEAWIQLGSCFLRAYPCDKVDPETHEMVVDPDGARRVHMFVFEENPYGIEQNLICKSGDFSMCDRVPVSKDQYERLSPIAFS